MLRDLLTWWAARLRELVPAGLRAGFRRAADAVVAETVPGGAAVRLLLRRRGRETLIGMLDAADPVAWRARLARAPRATVLRLQPGGTAMGPLTREVVLPLAAERDLDRVLRYEMDRVTPFAATDVFWTATVAARDRARNRLGVRLTLVPRAALGPVLAVLAAAGRTPSVLETGARAGEGDRIALDGPHARGIVWQRRGLTGLAVLCSVLSAAAVVLPFVRQSLALMTVERRIATWRPAVDEAAALRQRIAAARSGVDLVTAQRVRVGDVLAVLATLTEILPDDTYLTELTLAQRKLGLRGQSGGQSGSQSGGAARLIALLAADPAIRNPAFSAPVVRNEAGRSDIFSLQAEIAP